MMDDEDMRQLESIKAARMRELREQSENLTARQEALRESLNALGERLEVLEQRLRPVLREQDGLEAALHATPQVQASPLAGFLHSATEHAMDLQGRVGELIDRVDL